MSTPRYAVSSSTCCESSPSSKRAWTTSETPRTLAARTVSARRRSASPGCTTPAGFPRSPPVSSTSYTRTPDTAKRCSVPPQVTVSSSACGTTATTCSKRWMVPRGTRRSVVKSRAAQSPAAPARLKLAPRRMRDPARGHRMNRTTSVSPPETNRSDSYRADVVAALGQWPHRWPAAASMRRARSRIAPARTPRQPAA